jgi:hypothetical protein
MNNFLNLIARECLSEWVLQKCSIMLQGIELQSRLTGCQIVEAFRATLRFLAGAVQFPFQGSRSVTRHNMKRALKNHREAFGLTNGEIQNYYITKFKLQFINHVQRLLVFCFKFVVSPLKVFHVHRI